MKKIYSIIFLLLFVTAVVNAADRYAVATGNWNATTTWSATSGGASGASVPVAGDNVFIEGGFTVTITSDVACTNLDVGTGTSGTLRFGDGTARTLTVSGNVTIASGSTVDIADFNDTHTFNLAGHLTNNGTLDLNGPTANDLCNVTFNGAANQTVSGTGGTTDFNLITINNTGAANNNIVEVSSTNFTVATDFLTLTDGILKLSGSYTLSNDFFTTAGYTIPVGAGLWLNNANVTVTGQNASPDLLGELRITAGTYNVGSGAFSNSFEYGNGSVFTMEGGALNINARFIPLTTANTITFNMSGGTITTVVASTNSSTSASFDISAAGSSFTMSGGTIVIEEADANTGGDYRNLAGTVSITGGTLQFGNANTGSGAVDDFDITFAGTHTMPNMTIVDNGTSVPTLTLASGAPINIRGNFTINTGTTLSAGGQALSISGNFTNDGTFTPGTQTTTFNGSSAQTIGGTTAITFSSLTINNTSGGVSLNQDISLSGTMTFTSGIVTTTSANLLTFNAGSSTPGGSSSSFVDGPVAKVGSTAFTFPVGKSGAGLRTIGIGAPSVSSTFTAEFFRANPQSAFGSAKGAGILQVGACEYWVLDRTGTGDATVILSWAATSTCNGAGYVTDLPTLRVARWTGSLWEDRTNAATTGTTTAGTITSNTVTSFSPFVLAGSSNTTNPLPVNLSNIRAYEKQQGIQIDWTAYHEENLSHYSVERSADGLTFASIGQVSSLNSAVEKSYGFFDASPLAGINLYRLRTNDMDGKFGYSAIVKVNLDRSVKDISLYPNPTTGGYISFQGANLVKGNYTVKIFNSAGMQVLGQSFTHSGGAINQTLQLPNGTKSGMYSLQLVSDGVKVMSKTFIVQ